jgi:OOP family OmpA-OmpF porin
MSLNKKTIAALFAVTGVLATSACFAQGKGQDGRFYVGGSYGQATANDFCSEFAGLGCDDQATAWKIFAGYQVNRNFAIEATYLQTDDFTVSGNFLGIPVTANVDATAFGLAAVGMLPVASNFTIFGKLGVIKTEAEGSASAGPFTEVGSGDETGLHFGFGAMFNVTPQFAIRAEWEKVDKGEFDVLSIGAQFKF